MAVSRTKVKLTNDTMDLGRGPIRMMSTYDMNELDWTGVDVVLECTGKFNDGEKAKVHMERGAKKVLLSAPGKNVDKTVVFGVNDEQLAANDRDDLERVMHHQLPRPTGEGTGPRLWHRAWRDDDHPQLHRRPTHAGPPP